MTANQIAYAAHRENVRHNQASEGETYRSNVARETETQRHNVASEGIELGKLNETSRHNLVTEAQQDRHLVEQNRHNVATEGIESAKVLETGRHNKVQEGAKYIDQTLDNKKYLLDRSYKEHELGLRVYQTKTGNTLKEIEILAKREGSYLKTLGDLLKIGATS